MAFEIYNWSCVSGSLNQGLVTAAIATPSSDSSVAQGSMNLFSYYSAGDDLATIEASNYFLPVIYDLQSQDVIMVTGSDSSVFLQVETVTLPANGSAGTVTVQSFTAAGTVGTSNITNLAVTTAKINDLAVTSGKIANNAVDYAQLALDVAQLSTTTISNAQLLGMYATPIQLVAAGASGTLLVLDKLVLDYAWATADTAAGGAIAVQYGNSAHGAGVAASVSIAAATLNALGAASILTAGSTPVAAIDTSLYAEGLFLSNATGAFTTGAGTMTAYTYYKVLTPA
jgi:hypothetical protein